MYFKNIFKIDIIIRSDSTISSKILLKLRIVNVENNFQECSFKYSMFNIITLIVKEKNS